MRRLPRAGWRLAAEAGGQLALLFAALWAPHPAIAQVPEETRFDAISDFGGVGLLQMPTARFSPEGEISFSSSHVSPYFRNAVTLQPLPWVEGVLRYTTIENRPYGPTNFSGNQRYKDRGLDIKFLLIKESASFPQVAAGFRDVGGTGLFSSEYLVLSRRYYDFDFTLGMGWGNLGSRGQLPNPLKWLSDSFANRATANNPGDVASQYFHGDRVSLFGGISYRTPIPNLTVRLELDGNDYRSEPKGNSQKVSSPVNVGLTYSHGDWLDFSLGVERGNTLMAQLVLRGDLHKSPGLPKLDPPPEKLKPRNLAADIAAPPPATEPHPLELRLARALEANGYIVDGLAVKGRHATVKASQKTYRVLPKAVGRAARIVANEVPAEVDELTYINSEAGLETGRITLLRKDLENAERFRGSPEEIAVTARIEGPLPTEAEALLDNPDRYPAFAWSWAPAMRHHIGGPDNPYFYQIFLRLDGDLQLAPGLSVTGGLGLDLHNNFADLKLPSNSQLPHVRSDIKHYLKEGKNGITRLQADFVTNLGQNWYGRLSTGLFEEMFGGAGGELLYRPYGERWAAGADVYRVRQRDYDERFSFRDYTTTTGHVDVYYQLPYYNLLTQISVGRYLAGDEGVTVDISRRFDSGTVIGAFVTKTNISAKEFGEGSFDKGLYISIPLDIFSMFSSRSSIGMGWRPLTRDGGQRLSVGKRLYPILMDSQPEAMLRDWGELVR